MTIGVISFLLNQDISGECAHRESKGRLQWVVASLRPASGHCGHYQEQDHSENGDGE